MGILNLPPETILTGCRKNVFALIVLSIIILAIYSNTFHDSWHFDDEPNILKNPPLHLTSFTWDEIKKTFFALPKHPGMLYRPISCLSLALNYYFSKEKVFSYHLVNLIIHYITAVFLFLFIQNSLNLPLIKAKYRNHSYSLALLASLFWASNPIQTQAITYIVQRMASMAGMFYIASMYFYLKGKIVEKPQLKILFFSFCAIAGLMAIGSKENAFMLPISIYLFDLFLIQGISKETLKKNFKIILIIILSTIFIGLLYYFISQKSLSFLHRYETRAFTLEERLLSQPWIIVFYLSLIFYSVPMRLSVEHDISISKTLLEPPTTLLSILLIIGILILALSLSRRRPFIAFGVIFFFLNHLIEASFLPLELIFEHRNYIPSMLIFVPVAILLVNAIDYYSSKKLLQIIIIIFIVSVIVGQGHSTFIRNFLWKTEESLWMDATEKAPDLWRPWHNLGKFYADYNMRKEALTNYRIALSKRCNINPKDKHLTFYNMGLEYHKMGEKDKALFYYLKSEEIYPPLANAHNNKAIILAEKGLVEDAIYEFSEAIRYDNNLPHAFSNLGFLLLKIGRIEEAITQLERALTLQPHDTATLLRLGYAYKQKGLYGKAFMLFKRVQKLDPQNPKVLLYISEIYSRSGMNLQADKALEQFIERARDADLQSLVQEITEKEEKFDRIQVDKEVLMKLLAKVYLKKASLISSIRPYLDEKDLHIGGGEVHPETQ